MHEEEIHLNYIIPQKVAAVWVYDIFSAFVSLSPQCSMLIIEKQRYTQSKAEADGNGIIFDKFLTQ